MNLLFSFEEKFKGFSDEKKRFKTLIQTHSRKNPFTSFLHNASYTLRKDSKAAPITALCKVAAEKAATHSVPGFLRAWAFSSW